MKINLAKIVLCTVFIASIESLEAQTGQTVTLTLAQAPGVFGANSVTNFQVPSNVVAQIACSYIPVLNYYDGYIKVTFNGISSQYGPVYRNISQPGPIFVGPATISLVATNTGSSASVSSFCTIQTTSSLNFTPSSSVVIPNDGGGPVTIILESSTDLINWVPAEPGTYGTTSSNRFFRVRAQR